MFKALLLTEADGAPTARVEQLEDERLPEGDVTVAVEYSTLNYKDGMILKGLGRLVRSYPHVPGVDFAGTVLESRDPRFQPGQAVVCTGFRVGELRWGGYAEKARVPGDFLLPLPEGLTARQAMALGTAGLTAALAVAALEEHGLRPGEREVLVTGAAGGVGSLAVVLLAKAGHRVAASTGRPETEAYLRRLGASTLVDRAELAEPSTKPLESERWGGCVDTVGGVTLSRVLAQLAYGCSVAAVGNAGGNELRTTVLPLLLRGVNLLGIDSVMCPLERRRAAWGRLASEIPPELLEEATTEASLEDLPRLAEEILAGRIRGRVVIDVRR
jgi:acrylyl-CoA reductase (NADPH)